MAEDMTVEMEPVGMLAFSGLKKGTHLSVSYTLSLPCTDKELDTFLKAAKKFTGQKEIEICDGLFVTFQRGAEPSGKFLDGRRTIQYPTVVEAINDYFETLEDETLVVPADEESEGDGDDQDTEN